MIRSVLFAFILSFVTQVAQAQDRFPLVQAAHRIFCPLVQHVLLAAKRDSYLHSQQKFLLQIRSLCQSGVALQKVPNFNGYAFKNADSNRFMGIADGSYGPILVSADVLNRDSFASAPLKPFNLLLQTLMHEYANMVPGVDQGIKDQVARHFAEFFYGYENAFEGSGFRVIQFSIPADKIDQEYAIMKPNQVQPSYALFVDGPGGAQDLTPVLDQQVTALSPRLRTTWTEANRMALAAMPLMYNEIQKQLPAMEANMRQQLYEDARRKNIPKEKVDQMNLSDFFAKFRDLTSFFKSMIGDEMRLFELHQTRVEEAQDGVPQLFVFGSFKLNRSKVDYVSDLQEEHGADLTIDDENMGLKKIITVPLVLQVNLKTGRIDASLRPELNYKKIAKVGQISRAGSRVKMIKVKADLSGPATSVHLRVGMGSKYILIPSEPLPSTGVQPQQVEFIIPDFLENVSAPAWADSILIDQSKSYMLDRLVQVQEGVGSSKPLATATLQMPAFVLRDFKNQPQILPAFHPLLPILAMTPEWVEFMTHARPDEDMQDGSTWVNIDKVELRFGLKGEQKIRQVRVQMTYDVTAGEPTEEEIKKAIKSKMQVGEKILEVWSHADGKDQEQYYPTIIFDDLSLRPSAEQTVVVAKARVPLLTLSRPLKAGYGYKPPMIRPLKLEVVLDDAQMTTLTHEFPNLEIPGCDEFLR